MLRVIPLGGLGEIGLNMMVCEAADAMLVVDAGLMFPEDHMLGVDFVIPDMSFVRLNRHRLKGLVLTHAHEDHIGALPFLLKDLHVPVFGTAFTLGLVRQKLAEFEIPVPAGLHLITPGQPLALDPFRIDFIRVGHSVVDGVGLAIHTPEGLLVHTGDFKISPGAAGGMSTDLNAFARCGERGVLALMSDSTNIERDGATLPDAQIGETLARIAARSPGRIIVYLQLPAGSEVSIELVSELPDERVLIITTGSQGEPMSALARMAAGTHKQIKIKKGDTVVLSSKFIPGNERAITRIIDNLYRRGAEVVYEKISDVHASGHAFRDELRLMINLTRPRYFIPIHGEYRHLVLHGRLAQETGIDRERVLLVENGQVIEFENGAARLQGCVGTGRVLIDGKGVGDVGRAVLKERRMLSEEGFVAVTLAFDEATGIIVYGPEILSKGFVFETETGHLLQDAHCVVLEVVEELPPETPHRIDRIRTRLQTELRQYFFYTIGRRPVILPFVMEV
ncbi:MAG: ribonuclease J [Desulfobacterales bacterium]|nr:ribonuclease J [Desulfobacterales bacterium]